MNLFGLGAPKKRGRGPGKSAADRLMIEQARDLAEMRKARKRVLEGDTKLDKLRVVADLVSKGQMTRATAEKWGMEFDDGNGGQLASLFGGGGGSTAAIGAAFGGLIKGLLPSHLFGGQQQLPLPQQQPQVVVYQPIPPTALAEPDNPPAAPSPEPEASEPEPIAADALPVVGTPWRSAMFTQALQRTNPAKAAELLISFAQRDERTNVIVGGLVNCPPLQIDEFLVALRNAYCQPDAAGKIQNEDLIPALDWLTPQTAWLLATRAQLVARLTPPGAAT